MLCFDGFVHSQDIREITRLKAFKTSANHLQTLMLRNRHSANKTNPHLQLPWTQMVLNGISNMDTDSNCAWRTPHKTCQEEREPKARPVFLGFHLCRTRLLRKVFNPPTKSETRVRRKEKFDKRPKISPKKFITCSVACHWHFSQFGTRNLKHKLSQRESAGMATLKYFEESSSERT